MTADQERFLILKARTNSLQEIDIVLNWFEKLKGKGSRAMIDTTKAHYQITEKIGQGCTGEVYRATDTKKKG